MFPNDDLELPREQEATDLQFVLLDEVETYLDDPCDLPPAWIWRIIEDAFGAEPLAMPFDLLRQHLDDEGDEESLDELRQRLNEQIRNAAPLQIWGYETMRRVGELMP